MNNNQKTPFENLPKNMERLNKFGWRPDISEDGKNIVFVNKEFGDVFTMNLETKEINCITDTVCPNHPDHGAFIRASYLPNGDYLLVGMKEWPKEKPDQKMPLYSRARHEECHMFYLSKEPGSLPIQFGPAFYEAAAIGKYSMKVGYVINWWADSSLPEGKSELYVADLKMENGKPSLKNPKKMMESSFPPDGRLAAVGFYKNDTKLLVISYDYTPMCGAHALSLDIASGEVTDVSVEKYHVDEPAATCWDEDYCILRSSRHVKPDKFPPEKCNLEKTDLYLLKLDGTGKDCKRLTYVSDIEGFKCNDATVSRDGKFMIVQISGGLTHNDMTSRGFLKYTF